MPVYEYTAMDGSGEEKKGKLAADSERDAATKLKEMGMFPTMIEEVQGQIPPAQQGKLAQTAPVQESQPAVTESGDTTSPPPASVPPPASSPLASNPPPEQSQPTKSTPGSENMMAVELRSLPGITHLHASETRTLCGEDIESGNTIPFSECVLNCPRCRRIYNFIRSVDISINQQDKSAEGVKLIVGSVRKALLIGMPIQQLLQTLEALQGTYTDFAPEE